MIERDLHRLAMLQRCRSAHALPLEEMVTRADAAAAKAIGDYHGYLAVRLREIEITARRRVASWGPESWGAFSQAVHDVRISAAMAGEEFVREYARLLSVVLWRCGPNDPQLEIAIRLLLAAISAAADRSFPAAELSDLQSALTRICGRLSRSDCGPDSAKASVS